jgi:hypothetical protein
MLTHKQQFLKKHGFPLDESLSFQEIAELSNIPMEALFEVYKRGIGAWKSNIASVRLQTDYTKNPDTRRFPRSRRLGKEQWAAARVYAFVNRTPKVYYGADNDIREEFGLD